MLDRQLDDSDHEHFLHFNSEGKRRAYFKIQLFSSSQNIKYKLLSNRMKGFVTTGILIIEYGDSDALPVSREGPQNWQQLPCKTSS